MHLYRAVVDPRLVAMLPPDGLGAKQPRETRRAALTHSVKLLDQFACQRWPARLIAGLAVRALTEHVVVFEVLGVKHDCSRLRNRADGAIRAPGGGTRNPGPTGLDIKVLNVDGWATDGDAACETATDFLDVTAHRLIHDRVRDVVSRMRKAGFSCVWSPASQDTSHVGAAGDGVVSLWSVAAPVPTIATPELQSFMTKVVRSGVCRQSVVR